MAELAQTSRLLDMATLSHVGHVRQRNQDFFFTQPDCGLAVVADGVGGQGDGGWASREAIRLFADNIDCRADGGPAREASLLAALQAAHQAMRAQNRRQSDAAPSGTTIAGLWAPHGAGEVTAFNVGDSPVLHYSRGAITQVSRDHSLHQMWLDGGRVGREPSRRTIMQAVGVSDVLSPHFHAFAARPGDIVLICTDGLSGNLPLARIAEIMGGMKTAQAICESLVSEVLLGPAPDNVTASVCCF
jgi:protein phosphatase